MRLQLNETKDALDDVIAAADYLAEVASFNTSDQFIAAVKRAYSMLADLPGMGTVRDDIHPRLANVRMWPIREFRRYLIFYQANETELTILHVLNGAQDIERIFNPPNED